MSKETQSASEFSESYCDCLQTLCVQSLLQRELLYLPLLYCLHYLHYLYHLYYCIVYIIVLILQAQSVVANLFSNGKLPAVDSICLAFGNTLSTLSVTFHWAPFPPALIAHFAITAQLDKRNLCELRSHSLRFAPFTPRIGVICPRFVSASASALASISS